MVPAGWQQQDVNGHLVCGPADGSVAIMVIIPEEQDFEKACDGLDGLIGEMITDVKVNGEGKEGEHNGMKTFTVDGTGKSEGKDAEWSVDIVAAKKLALILVVGEKAGMEANAETLGKFAESVKMSES